MGKYHAYVLASTKRLGRFRERLTTKSDWAVTAALNLLWERGASVGGLSDGNPAEAGLFAINVWVLRLFMKFSHVN